MAVESLRGAYGKTLLKLGRENQDLVVLDADLAKSTQTQVFAKEFAGRFIDMGRRLEQMAGLVDAQGAAQYRMVRLGKKEGGLVEVLSGLNPGDKVVTGNAQAVNNGDKIQG